MLDLNATVATTVLEHSECAAVFQRKHIDFCCNGGLTLAQACERRGVDPVALVAELSHAIQARNGESSADPRALSTEALLSLVVSRHHERVRKALPLIRMLAKKVARVHGEHNPKLVELDRAFAALAEQLEPHLDAEEQVLFPALAVGTPDPAQLGAGFAQMQRSHLALSSLLEEVRAAADDFTLPDWACNSYRTLFSELEQLEGALLGSVHLETHVLMPRFARA